ncbi:diguanylate cyclase [Polynucleobacter sp. 35-46-11]|jgi:predicted signal transduction protein with EAL and GGDEF domain|uniref:GGDEF domain-containing protein n=1 Tax=unclassified Polynucleobacter TaxID=2640945 RepID=UPI000BD2878E|nr:diguanylate cyclase [Polynucleobacter sp. 35-46-11]OYY19462.1 MAG: hypothetical protein B7Y67_05555 [Polynucleobacter sp. 35-46-11]OZA74604.1 MAG: hypothetical protein B7X71_13065 [Polynucleobacter sp. 39-46-10]
MNTNTDSARIIESTPVKLIYGEIHYSASIGIARYDENLGIGSVVDLADRALYLAKKNGRNRVEMANWGQLADLISDQESRYVFSIS